MNTKESPHGPVDRLVRRLREAAKNGALPIGEAWNLIDEAADAVEKLRQVLGDLLLWFPDEPSPPEWRFLAGEHGADEAVQAAREALDEDDEDDEVTP